MFLIDVLIFSTALLLFYYYNTYANNRIVRVESYAQINSSISTLSLYVLILGMRFGAGAVFNTSKHIYTSGASYFLITVADVLGILLYYPIIKKIHVHGKFLSIGEMMGKFYDKKIRFITAVCSILFSITVVSIQFKGIYKTIDYLFNINFSREYFFCIIAIFVVLSNLNIFLARKIAFKHLLILAGSLIGLYFSIAYDIKLTVFFIIVAIATQGSFGGVSNLIFKSSVYFSLLVLLLPIIFNEIEILNLPVENISLKDLSSMDLIHMADNSYILIFFYRILPILTPTLMQRISFASSSSQATKAFIFASLTLLVLYHLISICSLTVFKIDPNINPQDCFLHLIKYILRSPGLLGIALCCILSIMFSSIDAFTNISATALALDIFNKPVALDDFKLIRICVTLTTLISLMVSYFVKDMFFLFTFGLSIWGTIITIPLFAAILGFKVSSEAFYASCISGFIINALYYMGQVKILQIIGPVPVAFLFNTVVFVAVNALYSRATGVKVDI